MFAKHLSECGHTCIGTTREHERQENEGDGGAEEEHADKVRLDDETPRFLQESSPR